MYHAVTEMKSNCGFILVLFFLEIFRGFLNALKLIVIWLKIISGISELTNN
jgi:hypothetical protein